ncbi:hypothetical protein BpHYR1_012439 [Brachionus plicatilis]|uniref:Uncharacterized protein n=1 Tax=Brachionus plicatilis TaxID=10195 RepID=A0A3M7SVW8_BRAPC|nr:hypothetical protein BpHYR1_012439 [Brachionus plicatilis]
MKSKSRKTYHRLILKTSLPSSYCCESTAGLKYKACCGTGSCCCCGCMDALLVSGTKNLGGS